MTINGPRNSGSTPFASGVDFPGGPAAADKQQASGSPAVGARIGTSTDPLPSPPSQDLNSGSARTEPVLRQGVVGLNFGLRRLEDFLSELEQAQQAQQPTGQPSGE